MPARRSHRFGLEQQVDLNNLETAITDFAQSCNKKVKLVLIGFEMAAEWEYLFSLFPRAMPLFSAWVDLRDIANDIASSVGVIPGLGPLLQHFGYHWKDIKPGRGSSVTAAPRIMPEMMLWQLVLWPMLFSPKRTRGS